MNYIYINEYNVLYQHLIYITGIEHREVLVLINVDSISIYHIYSSNIIKNPKDLERHKEGNQYTYINSIHTISICI